VRAGPECARASCAVRPSRQALKGGGRGARTHGWGSRAKRAKVRLLGFLLLLELLDLAALALDLALLSLDLTLLLL